MPYIDPVRRVALYDNELRDPQNAGELNFVITAIVLEYIASLENYQRYNDVLGALEGAKLELYRRAVAPYEDVKIARNGDVY